MFGVAQGEIREMVESGQVEFKHLEAAMQNLTAEGGKFAGLMEAQSKTVAGTFSLSRTTSTPHSGRWASRSSRRST